MSSLHTRLSFLGPALFATLALGISSAHAAPPGGTPRRVLPKRCESPTDETRPCGDLSESVSEWFGEQRGSGGFGGGSGASLALVVAADTLLTSTMSGQELGLFVGGTGPLLSWQVGAGIHHAFEAPAFGFSLSASGGLRTAHFSPLSVNLGIRFLNLTDFYDGTPERPAQHLLGELGVSYDVPVSGALMVRFGLSALLGAERRVVARFESAREVVDELTTLSGGGFFRVALWVR